MENDEERFYGSIKVPFTYFLENEIPGVKSVMRFYGRRTTVKYKENRIEEFLNFTNKPFIDNFGYELINGSYKYFSDANALYISSEMAEKYFKGEPAVGKEMDLLVKDSKGGIQVFVVRGVFQQPKNNSSFNYVDLMTNFDNLTRIHQIDLLDTKTDLEAEIYIKVGQASVIENPAIYAKLEEFATATDENGIYNFYAKPFSQVHKRVENGLYRNYTNNEINRGTLMTFNLMGILILLIACFNYTIYAFSFAGKRLKEIGVRKVSGSSPRQIMFQFLAESLLLSIMALFISFFLLEILAPFFESIWGNLPYNFSDTNPFRIAIFLLIFILIVTFVAGFYPAFYVSRFNPSSILAKNARMKKSGWFTLSLITLQQVVTIIGLGASIVFTDNVYWQENMDFGYDKDNLLTVQGLNAIEKDEVFLEMVKQHPKVVSAGISWKMLGNGTGDRKVVYEGEEYYVDLMETGPNYMETNKVRLVEGRFWNTESIADMQNTALVNRKFLNVVGGKDILGKQITLLNGKSVTVVGVIENYKHIGAFGEYEPTVIHYPFEGKFKFLAIRGKSMKDLEEINSYCKAKWEEIEPFYPYTSMYESGNIIAGLDVSKNFKRTFLFAAIIALILSITGVFSLVTMLVQNRTKEIAIRKTIGGGIQNILMLISKPYLFVNIIAGIIGSAVGIIIVKSLLDNIYDYHVQVKVSWYVLASLIMLFITVVTISTQTIRAAMANPVKGLRYE